MTQGRKSGRRVPLRPLQAPPLRPVQLPGLPPQADPVASAAMWGYVRLAWASADPPGCDAATAAMMAGCIIGQRTRVLMDVHGLGLDAAKAAVLAWVEEA